MLSDDDKIEIALQLPKTFAVEQMYTWTDGSVVVIAEHAGNFSGMGMPDTLFVKDVQHKLANVGHISYTRAKYRYAPC